MIYSDFHVHSSFSADSQEKMQDIIEYAIKVGIKNLCFTEHHDLGMPNLKYSFLLDFKEYSKAFFNLKTLYENKINLFFGVELGVQAHLWNDLSKIINDYPLDFVLCSQHMVNGKDPYDPDFFDHKTKEAAYSEYLEAIYHNSKNFSDYDVHSHLDYVTRHAPYEDRSLTYGDFGEFLDEILKNIINNGKGIEVNTSGFKFNAANPHPTFEIIKRYRELGGEIITVGSDSHKASEIGRHFQKTEGLLKSAGFKYYTIFKERNPEFILL